MSDEASDHGEFVGHFGDSGSLGVQQVATRGWAGRLASPLAHPNGGVAHRLPRAMLISAFTADSKLLAVGNIYPSDPSGNTAALSTGTALVLGMAFSSNGRILATRNKGRALILRDTTDLAAAHDLGPPVTTRDLVLHMRFAPDNRTLTTVDITGNVTPWDLTGVVDLQDNAVRQACGITGTGLDEQDWGRVRSRPAVSAHVLVEQLARLRNVWGSKTYGAAQGA